MEGKIPSIAGLVTTAALTAVKNKIPRVSNLVKKHYDAKILDTKSKHITTSDYNKFMGRINHAKVKRK